MKPDHVIHTDILVMGGGLAGCWAAQRAKDFGVDVLVVDKGKVSFSGATTFAEGIIALKFPEDDLQEWLREKVELNHYLCDQEWVRMILEKTYDRAIEIDQRAMKYGISVFLKDEKGNLMRRKSRGQRPESSTRVCTFDTKKLMATLRRMIIEKKVELLERVMITDLVELDNEIVGALGLHTRTGEFYLVVAKAIILAAGGCTFKSFYLGHRNLTGEAQAMAYRVGAALRNLEQAMSNSTARQVDIHGMGGLSKAGKFINKDGEEFMWRYDPHLGSGTMMHTLTQSFAKEISAGRGPVYFDLTGMTRDNLEYFKRLIPEFFLSLERIGIDPLRNKIEWIPAFLGTMAYGGGVHIDHNAETTRKGLFAVGDTVASEHCLMFCITPGEKAAENAVKRVTERKALVEDKKAVIKASEEILSRLVEPLKRKAMITPDEVVYRIQKILIPYDVCYIRNEERLNRALKRLDEIKNEDLRGMGVSSLRELVKSIEVQNMVSIAEMILRAALFRKESRGFHFREDFPKMDNENWLKWVMIEKRDHEMHLYTKEIDLPYVKP